MLVPALIDDSAAIHHHDPIGLEHGCQTVGDDQGGAAFHQALQGLLDGAFALGVERAGGFIEQQDRGILEQRPSDRDALFLATRQTGTALAEVGAIAIRKFGQEVVRFGAAGGGEHVLIAGAESAVADVVQGIGAEQHRILGHQGDRRTQVGRVECGQVEVIDQNPSGLRVVEAQQQLQDGALAGTRGADQGDRFAGSDMQVEAHQCRGVGTRGVSKIDPLEADLAACRLRQHDRTARCGDARPFGQQFADPGHAARRALHFAPDFGQGADRAGAEYRIQHELAERAGTERPRYDILGADPEHEGDRAEDQHDHDCRQQCLGADAPLGGQQGIGNGTGESTALVILSGIALHRVDCSEGLGGARIGIGDAVLADRREPADPAPEQDDRGDRQRDADQGQRRQSWAGQGDHDRAAGQSHQAAQGHRNAGTDHAAQQFGVGRQARDQFTAAGPLEEAHVQAEQMVVDRAPQVGDHPLAEQADVIEAECRCHRQHHGDYEQAGEPEIDRAGIVGTEAAIDHQPDRNRQAQGGARRQHQESEPGRDQSSMGNDQGQQCPQRGQRAASGGRGISHRRGSNPVRGAGRVPGWHRARRRAGRVGDRREREVSGMRRQGESVRPVFRPGIRLRAGERCRGR